MHHLGNFSIRHVERVGPTTRAPPRGEPVAPLSIIRPLLVACSAPSLSHAHGWRLGDLHRVIAAPRARRDPYLLPRIFV